MNRAFAFDQEYKMGLKIAIIEEFLEREHVQTARFLRVTVDVAPFLGDAEICLKFARADALKWRTGGLKRTDEVGLADTGRVIVGNDDRGSAEPQGSFGYNPRVYTGTVYGALEQVLSSNNTVPCIQEQTGENLTFSVSQYGLQVFQGHRGAG